MTYNALDDGVQKGSGRVRLPSRLRDANFAATMAAKLAAALAAVAADTILAVTGPVQLKSYTTTARNTLATGWTTSKKGVMVYDSTLDCVIVWTGAAWSTPDGGVPA